MCVCVCIKLVYKSCIKLTWVPLPSYLICAHWINISLCFNYFAILFLYKTLDDSLLFWFWGTHTFIKFLMLVEIERPIITIFFFFILIWSHRNCCCCLLLRESENNDTETQRLNWGWYLAHHYQDHKVPRKPVDRHLSLSPS